MKILICVIIGIVLLIGLFGIGIVIAASKFEKEREELDKLLKTMYRVENEKK